MREMSRRRQVSRNDAPEGPFLRLSGKAIVIRDDKTMSATPTGDVRTQVWLEDVLPEGWMVAYRIAPDQGGRPVIAEAREYPGMPNRFPNAGEWSGDPAEVPDWGLRARLLKKLRPATTIRSFPDLYGTLKAVWGEDAFFGKKSLWVRHGLSSTNPEPHSHVGRPQAYDLTFYAVLARDYVRIRNGGSRRTMQELAKRRKTPAATVRNWRRTALNKGLLTESPPGVAGGQLTPRAIEVLKAAGEEVE